MQEPYGVDGYKHCIYCNPPSVEGLTDEHIVPKGLGGKRYIKLASCEKCRKITHKFETAALEDFLWPIRAHAGIKPSRPSRRRKNFDAWVQRQSMFGNVNIKKVQMPTERHPCMIAMPFYPMPRLSRLSPSKILHDQFNFVVDPGFQKDFASRVQATRLLSGGSPIFPIQDIKHDAFMRMLAKIAHCNFVEHKIRYPYPFEKYQSILSDAILNDNSPLSDFVGGQGVHNPGSYNGAGLHRLRFVSIASDYVESLVTQIQLFAAHNMPVYTVMTAFRTWTEHAELDRLHSGMGLIDIDTGEIISPGTIIRPSLMEWRQTIP